MIAVREAIFAEIEARLIAIGDADETERLPSGDPISFPARHIYDFGQTQEYSDTGVTRYTLSVVVEGYVAGHSGPEAHGALHALYANTIAVLVSEPPLGGLVETIDEGDLRIDVADLASERRLAFSLQLTITYPTRRGDPAQAA